MLERVRKLLAARVVGLSFLLFGSSSVLPAEEETVVDPNALYLGAETPLSAGGFMLDLQDTLVFPVFAARSDDGQAGVVCAGGARLGVWDLVRERTLIREPELVMTRTIPGGLTFQFQTTGGFTDPTPVLPVGGNSGTTLGEQRAIALQYAADIWGSTLQGTVPLSVDIAFWPGWNFSICTAGFAQIPFVFRNFRGAPLRHTFYFEPLANTLIGRDIRAGADFYVRLNGDFVSCSSIDFYYGLDGKPRRDQLDFVSLVLHEIGHGLGFAAPRVVYQYGWKLHGFDDAYTVNLEDHTTGKSFPNMYNGERLAASNGAGELHWVGPAVTSDACVLSSGVHRSGHVEMQTVIPASPSIDHFRSSLFPDELMEPFLYGAIHDPGLAVSLLVDLGWKRTESDDPADGDGDAVADAEDNCPSVWNAGRCDFDLDGTGDACELTVTEPLAGETLDCSDPSTLRPTIGWNPGPYDRFKVAIGWGSEFAARTYVTNGDKWLTARSWKPSAKRWRLACKKAAEANPTSPALFIRVRGLDTGVPKRDPARTTISTTVPVDVE